MKRWAAVTVALYLLCLSGVAVPLVWWLVDKPPDFLEIFYGFLVPVLLAVQAVLLAVPVSTATGRPVGRRMVRSAAILGALPMGLLLGLFVWCAALLLWGEKGTDRDWFGWTLLATSVGGWVFWGVVFHRCYSSDDPRRFTTRIARRLLAGSILETLVAIPSHVVARQREDCCAPAITLMGIVTGLSVALLAFGPATFLLIADRVRAKRRA